MYAIIRRYKIGSGSAEEVVSLVSQPFLPVVSQAPGLVAWYVMDGGDGVVASFSVFENQAQAEELNSMALGSLDRPDLQRFQIETPEVTAGEVMLHRGK